MPCLRKLPPFTIQFTRFHSCDNSQADVLSAFHGFCNLVLCQRFSSNILSEAAANLLLLRATELLTYTDPNTRVSMSPSSADVAQTPEPKSTSGLASVFKSLTGSKSLRNPNPQSPASSSQHRNDPITTPAAVYGGPPNFEQLYEQLKSGNTLADRISAAESLRHAVLDYPLDGVCDWL